MITNFEKITRALSPEEVGVILSLTRVLSSASYRNPIKADEIVRRVNGKQEKGDQPVFFSQVKLRKLVNFIRSESILPVIATSRGYYLSYDRDEIAMQIKSMEERADAITNAKNGLMIFLDK